LGILLGGPPQTAHHDHRHPEQKRHVWPRFVFGSWRYNAAAGTALRQDFVIKSRPNRRNLFDPR